MNRVYRLLERTFRWTTLRSGLAFSQKSPSPFTAAPSLTIARDPGSGGRPIARLVAKKLGYTFYDEALIESVALSTNKRARVIRKVDERTRSFIDDFVHSIINPDYISETTYLSHLARTVLSVAAHGKAVFLGRGTNFLLPREHAFHVLITAPYEVRVERAIKHEKVTRAKARSIIAKVTKEREGFVEEYFQREHNDPTGYDLVINTDALSIEMAADMIVAAFMRRWRA